MRRLPTVGDRAGMCMAGACALHCVGVPLLATLLPLFSTALESPGLEWAFLLVSLTTSAIVVVAGCILSHRRWLPLAPYVTGATLLLTVRLLVNAEGLVAQSSVIVGAGLLVGAHAWNIRLCRPTGPVTSGSS
jgi:hypothetical protein